LWLLQRLVALSFCMVLTEQLNSLINSLTQNESIPYRPKRL
jgi:hypothetical protein